MRQERLRHRFVEFIPDVVEDGMMYVSMEYMTVAHNCCCGCGTEVSTPLSPTAVVVSMLNPAVRAITLPVPDQ